MVDLLSNGYDLNVVRQSGEYVVTNPEGGSPTLEFNTYFIRVIDSVNRLNEHFIQQVAYSITTGDEFYRVSYNNGAWTEWLSRASIDSLNGSAVVALIDSTLGGPGWRTELTGEDIVDLIDAFLGSTDWQSGGGGGASQRLMASFPAAGAVGGHRVVVLDSDKVRHVDISDVADAFKIIGLSTTAASVEDDPVQVALSGQVDHTFGFTPGGAVYAGTSGILTQTPPSGGAFSFCVGSALAAGTLLINPAPPIIAAS